MKNTQEQIKSASLEEKRFIALMLKVMPKQWQDFFNAYKAAKPMLFHSFYRLMEYKAELLAWGDESAWNRLVEQEIKLLQKVE